VDTHVGGPKEKDGGKLTVQPLFMLEADDRFAIKEPHSLRETDEKLWPKFPAGYLGLTVATVKEDEQYDMFMPTDPRLITPNFAGDAEMGTLVCDLDSDYKIDKDRTAKLQSVFRVVKHPSGGPVDWGKNNVVALQITKSGLGDSIGGMFWSTDASGLCVGGMAASAYSGPFHCGWQFDTHKLARDADGNAINSMHLSTGAYFLSPAENSKDGPLDFEKDDYPDPESGSKKLKVHLVWDAKADHDHISGPKKGRWRWYAEGSFSSKESPCSAPRGGPGTTQSRAPGEGGPPSNMPGAGGPGGGATDPGFTFTDPSGHLGPGGDVAGPPGYEGTSGSVGPPSANWWDAGAQGAPGGSGVPGTAGFVDPTAGWTREQADERYGNTAAGGPARDPVMDTGVAGVIQGGDNAGGGGTSVVSTTTETQMPGTSTTAQPVGAGMPDTAHNTNPTPGESAAAGQWPTVARESGYSRQESSGSNPYGPTPTVPRTTYTHRPCTGYEGGGTADGGATTMPGDVQLYDYCGSVLSTTADRPTFTSGLQCSLVYRLCAPGASFAVGIPYLATGGVASGYSWRVKDGALAFFGHDSSGAKAEAAHITATTQRLGWRSGTSYYGDLAHAATAARVWTFPDLTDWVPLTSISGGLFTSTYIPYADTTGALAQHSGLRFDSMGPRLMLGYPSSSTGMLRLYSYNNSEYIELYAGTPTASISYQLPNTPPAVAGSALTCNVSTMSWTNLAALYAPIASAFVTIGNDATLTGERALTMHVNANLTMVDGGANSTVTLDTVQGIKTTSTPQFARLGLGAAADASAQLNVSGRALIYNSARESTFIQGGNETYTGNYNIGIGYYVMHVMTIGDSNLGIGYFAMRDTTEGCQNTALGTDSMCFNTTGRENTAVGFQALLGGTDASYNTAVGKGSLGACTHGSYNSALGYAALSNATSDGNTAVGYNAGVRLTTGTYNVFLGYQAGAYETGSSKLFIDNAPRASEADGRTKALLYGVFDAAVANQTLNINATVSIANRLGIGVAADANRSLAIAESMTMPATSSDTTGIVFKAANRFIHNFALGGTNGGNTFVGVNAGNFTMAGSTGAQGSYNSAMGMNALTSNTTGSYNSAMGMYAGYNGAVALQTLSYCTFVGHFASASVNALTNSMALGNGAQVTASNQIILGNASITACGIGTSAPGAMLDILKTSEQLRLSYSAAVYASHTVASTGIYTIAPTGNQTIFSSADATTVPTAVLTCSSTGDAALRFALGTTISYAMGIDNSVAGDPFVLSTAASGTAVLGTGNLLSITSAGRATFLEMEISGAVTDVYGQLYVAGTVVNAAVAQGGALVTDLTSSGGDAIGFVFAPTLQASDAGGAKNVGIVVAADCNTASDWLIGIKIEAGCYGGPGLGPAAGAAIWMNKQSACVINYQIYSVGDQSYWGTDLTNPLHIFTQTSTGDSYLRWTLGATISYALGIDNSDADAFVLSTAASGAAVLGTNNLLRVTPTDFNILGDLNHDGTNLGLYSVAPVARQTVTGKRNTPEEALKNLLAALALTGIIADGTTAS
jgi:hypothetical protein